MLTQHNIVYMMTLMRSMRSAILQGEAAYASFIRGFLLDMFYSAESSAGEEVSEESAKGDVEGAKETQEEEKAEKKVDDEEEKTVDGKVPAWVKEALTAAGMADLVFPLHQ